MDDSGRSVPPAGWYRDPTGHGDARYWTGSEWSDAVSRGGTTASIPISLDLRATPPVPGTEYVAPVASPSPQVVVVRPPADAAAPGRPRSPFAPLLGALLLAAAVVALIVVLVNSRDDEPAEPTPTEQVPDEPAEAPAEPDDGTTPSDGSG